MANTSNQKRKYIVPTKFGNSFALCRSYDFPVAREEGGLKMAIEFAKVNKSNVYFQHGPESHYKVELIWKNPIFK
jgi:hypothetical protein